MLWNVESGSPRAFPSKRLNSDLSRKRIQPGVFPDVIAFGKGVSGGYYPISGVLVHDKVAAVFEEHPANFLQHGYTYGGTPLGAATALAAIDYLEKEDIPAGVPPKAAQLRSGLENLATSHSVIGEVRGNGLLLALELVADPATGSRFALIGRSERVARALSQLGHHTLHGGPVDSIEPFGSRPAVLEPHRRDQQPECGGDSRSGGDYDLLGPENSRHPAGDGRSCSTERVHLSSRRFVRDGWRVHDRGARILRSTTAEGLRPSRPASGVSG